MNFSLDLSEDAVFAVDRSKDLTLSKLENKRFSSRLGEKRHPCSSPVVSPAGKIRPLVQRWHDHSGGKQMLSDWI